MTDDDFTGHGSEHPHGAARRNPHRPHRSGHGPQERQAVLVDARFWAWLHDDEGDGSVAPTARQELQDLLHQHGSRLVRTIWYTDHDAETAVPGLQVRRVPSNAQDQGVMMLRAMAQDLGAMAEHRSVDRVLLVSDDDRLLLAVDHAQRCGLMVDMLVDADSQDLRALRSDEPSWASLLQQADRLLVLGSPDAQARGYRPRGGQPDARLRREPPSAEASGIIEDEILTWWDDEAPEQREHWRQEVQASRGIPQELDRQLLLRISRRLGQALRPAEKSAMRQQVRQQVLGGQAAPGLLTTPPTLPEGA
ncbi:MAG: NYN domain-containing protein [Betaproteobacteria bacterium]|nr:NYN domain-containing protein [Betaproteobacteria bacterium]